MEIRAHVMRVECKPDSNIQVLLWTGFMWPEIDATFKYQGFI
jgi:hypothetical protein